MYALDELLQTLALRLAQGARLLVAARHVNFHVCHVCCMELLSDDSIREDQGDRLYFQAKSVDRRSDDGSGDGRRCRKVVNG